MNTLGDKIRALTQQVEMYDMLSEVHAMASEADELQRVNDDLEAQIHEDGGFIERIVALETASATYRELAVRNQASVLAVESLAYAYIREASAHERPLIKELMEQIGRDILKRLIVAEESPE